jgi:hypothetical protein
METKVDPLSRRFMLTGAVLLFISFFLPWCDAPTCRHGRTRSAEKPAVVEPAK